LVTSAWGASPLDTADAAAADAAIIASTTGWSTSTVLQHLKNQQTFEALVVCR
jgi:hypothetical protein